MVRDVVMKKVFPKGGPEEPFVEGSSGGLLAIWGSDRESQFIHGSSDYEIQSGTRNFRGTFKF